MTPLEELSFQYDWRVYQARILEELSTHLDDDRLHVVAAPGSGKTVLGLEVVRRLGKASVILAPTITIRDQWIQRLVSMFLPQGAPAPDWISTSLHEPGFLTVITYQALHAALNGKKRTKDQPVERSGQSEEGAEEAHNTPEKIFKSLNALRVETLVLDEAHHLRREWWKALDKLQDSLNNPTLVSLTATPPYDVPWPEWQRYEKLCGPADSEISVPELVKQGDLCPHQDYVYFSLPTKSENDKLDTFKKNIYQFTSRLMKDKEFVDAIASHPWILYPEESAEDILDDPSFFSAMLIFLNYCGRVPSHKAFAILGVEPDSIPSMSTYWLEILYTGVFYSREEEFSARLEHIGALRRELSRTGAVTRRKVTLENTIDVKKMLAASIGKMDSILDITRMESSSLGDGLRMVILADFIRKSEMPKSPEDLQPLSKIGVAPIFEHLRRAKTPGIKLGILTGSLIILPAGAQAMLFAAMEAMGMDASRAKVDPLDHDPSYVKLALSGQKQQQVVQLITEVFARGGVTVLVGTAALLGEGWDAPSVNSLVLASYVGSYMLSNQMRGRAIRTDPSAPQKTANIWHLGALDIKTGLATEPPPAGSEFIIEIKHTLDGDFHGLGDDADTLQRRFLAFEGPTFYEPTIIESGIRRLGIDTSQFKKDGVEQVNQHMLEQASQRNMLAKQWDVALQGASPKPAMRKKLESNYAPTGVIFGNTILSLATTSFFAGALLFLDAAGFAGLFSDHTLLFLSVTLILGLLVSVPHLILALYLWWRNGTLENRLAEVGEAILDTYYFSGLTQTPRDNLFVLVTELPNGHYHCCLDGGTAEETKLFLDALEEILSPVDNPRYLLVRESHWGGGTQIDYHAVPELMGRKKDVAEHFLQRWKHHVGKAQLVYARSAEGRRVLLKARTQALSSEFRKKTDRISVWE